MRPWKFSCFAANESRQSERFCVYKDETRERDNGETYPMRINSGISIQFSGYLQIHNFYPIL